MSKFHVGDKVRVVTDDSYNGQIGVVKRLTDGESKYWVVLEGEETSNVFGEDELRPADIKPQDDVVEHPSHYTLGMPPGVEVIDVIRAQAGSWELSNAIKYVLRARFKGSYVQDLKKAIRYLTWEVEREDGKTTGEP